MIIGTRIFYMSRPFHETEDKELKETFNEVKGLGLKSNNIFGKADIRKIKFNNYTVIIFRAKELSNHPESLFHLNTPHTNWIHITGEGENGKGIGEFFKMN